jgi:hypothetical protein
VTVSTIKDITANSDVYENRHYLWNTLSTETAMHNVVTGIENATEHKDIALGAFLEEGAIDGTSFDIIKQDAERHCIEPPVCRWICAMLESRNISTKLLGETLGATVARGCLQGGVPSSLLWSLVVDDLLRGLNNNGIIQQDMLII